MYAKNTFFFLTMQNLCISETVRQKVAFYNLFTEPIPMQSCIKSEMHELE